MLLVCATDTGGAKNLAPLADLIESEGLKSIVIASKASLCAFKAHGVKVEELEILDLDNAIRYLHLKKPAAVICGTTRYLSPERFLIAAARRLNIKCIVVLDEWFHYRMRFEDGKGQLTYLPDIICCQDEKAHQEAIAEGLPQHLLHVTGSPYLSALTENALDFLRDPPPVPAFLKGQAKPVIIFLSETHSVDYGNGIGEDGPLGEFIGYTEKIVRKDIFEVLNKIANPCTVVEKLHPSDEGLHESLGNKLIDWITIREAELWHLLWHSDLVIGMRSMSLLEAAILGCDTVSYQPNLIGPQLCTAVRLNLVKNFYDIDQLHRYIEAKISGKQQKGSIERRIKRFPFASDGALGDILHLALEQQEVERP